MSSKLDHRMAAFGRAASASLEQDLRPTTKLLLVVLHYVAGDGEPTTVTELGQYVTLSKTTIHKALRELEAAKFVRLGRRTPTQWEEDGTRIPSAIPIRLLT